MIIALLSAAALADPPPPPVCETTEDYPGQGLDWIAPPNAYQYSIALGDWVEAEVDKTKADAGYCNAVLSQYSIIASHCSTYSDLEDDACHPLAIIAWGVDPCVAARAGLNQCLLGMQDLMNAWMQYCT